VPGRAPKGGGRTRGFWGAFWTATIGSACKQSWDGFGFGSRAATGLTLGGKEPERFIGLETFQRQMNGKIVPPGSNKLIFPSSATQDAKTRDLTF